MSKGSGSGVGGCGLIFIGLLALAALMWAFKIGLIILGVLIMGIGTIGAVLAIPAVWIMYFSGKNSIRRGHDLDATLSSMVDTSMARLSVEMTEWDRIQSNRGLGTTLEAAYFRGEVDADTRRLFREVNDLMEEGESLRAQAGEERKTRQDTIRLADSIDANWLKLEKRRKSVTK